MKSMSFTELRELAAQAGLAIVAVRDASDLETDRKYLDSWQRKGYAGDMRYMTRDIGLLSSPRRLLSSAHTIVSIGAYYDRSERSPLRPGFGRVARYAWGEDYHKVLPAKLHSLCELVKKHLGETLEYRIFSDAVPLLERAVAAQAGMGFIGKNTMLIIPRTGSFLFLGEVLWNVEITDLPTQVPASDRSCGGCSRCLERCPTGAFVTERVLDARRCISYLTIEKRGALSWEERPMLGEWIFGCDVCQEECPFNVISLKRKSPPEIAEFSAERGAGQELSLAEVLAMRTDAQFSARFSGTPLLRTKREGLSRNAAVVAVNTGVVSLLPDLWAAFHEDSSALVRRHCLWGYWGLSAHEGTIQAEKSRELIRKAKQDDDEGVREEALMCEQHDGE